MNNFLHIYIKPRKEISRETIEEKISLAIDWYRYDDGLYIVYTSSDVSKWQDRLLPLVKSEGRLFICELNILKRNGWFNKDLWAWIKKNNNNISPKKRPH
ncbi:hypothetical protein J2Y38_001866 [Flavobacterium sp. 2755]|uniref:hypothetical protein n=1 Tax=Flavobacterium sp. 2755 TaxID=2817765 RepID=UPI00285B9722|nr:hypothetical protein [Flavobacterium sp. 2755]MDR6761657.1 hypothetical protein [Flavobacterium sp. 2755]